MLCGPWLVALSLVTSPGAAQPPTPDPGDAGYYFLLGRHLEDGGKVDEAIAALKRAIALAPDSAEPRAELAALYAREDRAAEALDAADDALKVDPKNREANRILGSVLAALWEERQRARPTDNLASYPKRATAALEIARGEGTGDLSVDLALARLYMSQKRPADAVPLLRRVRDESPGYAEGGLLLAEAQENSGAPGEAVDTLNAIVDENPSNFRARVQLAETLERQRKWKEAAAAWAAAQPLTQRANEIAARRAMALLNAGDSEAAEAAARALRAASPGDVRAAYILGVALEARNKFAEALPILKEAAAAAPDNNSIQFQYAAALDRTGNPAEAEKTFRAILTRDPLDATALNYLGYMLADRGDRLDEAVSLIQRALKVDPGNASFLDSLGWAYFRQGKLDLADSPLSSAAEKQPKNSVIQDHLGDLRFKQRRKDEAIAAWQRALDGDGDSIDRAKIEKKIADARRE